MSTTPDLARSVAWPHDDRQIELSTNVKGEAVFFLFWDYFPELHHAIASIAGARWRPQVPGNPWEVSTAQALAVCRVARRFDFHLTQEVAVMLAKVEAAEAARLLAEAEHKAKLERALDALELEKMRVNGEPLYHHQIEGVRWLCGLAQIKGEYIHAPGRGIVADDIGTGKTIEALVTAKVWHEAYGLLAVVISPRNLVTNWQREAGWVGVQIKTTTWAKIPKATTRPFFLIAEEAHRAQSLDTDRTQRLITLALTEHCRAALMVTGTPARGGRPKNEFPLLVATRHPLGDNVNHFEKYFCGAEMKEHRKRGGKRGEKVQVYDTRGATNLAQLERETRNVVLRRLRSECLDLPRFRRVLRPVLMTEAAQANYTTVYRAARARYFARLKAGVIKKGGEAFILLNHLRLANSVGKVAECAELITEALEQGLAPLVFTDFLDSANALASHFLANGFKVELLTGESTEDSQKKKDRFQAGDSQLWVSTMKSGGEGLTLTRSNLVVMHDRGWLVDDSLQCEGRAFRSGQKLPVTSLWLQSGKVDARIDAALLEQAKQLEAMQLGQPEQARLDTYHLAAEIAAEVFQSEEAE